MRGHHVSWQTHLRRGERQQGGQDCQWDTEAAWGKTLEASLAVFDGGDQRVPLSADTQEMDERQKGSRD